MEKYAGEERRCKPPHNAGCDLADQAADSAVRKTFAILGVNIDDPKQVKEFQASLSFNEALRKAAMKGSMAFWGTIGAAIAGLVFVHFFGDKVK